MSPPSFLTASCYVAAGGALGSWLRFLVARAFSPMAGAFPWATLTVNVVGSFAMGLLAGWLARMGSHGEGWRLLIGVGVLGGFTTFSAFSLDFTVLVERGALGMAMTYVAASLIAGFGGLFAGLFLVRAVA
ncbi:fluoride efflux transporter CrcB [Novosphingobium sp. PS1R-30]|uniref:Fluoride-specific ion channel FluC n=1 Tax=Novosphingobium anseongense TaxID=3133436 RepID=A0ABU8RQB3_9SPHN